MFYFKLLKAMIVIFIIMNLLTLPAMLIYLNFNVTDPMDVVYNRDFTAVRQLSYTTLGALGGPIPSCRKAFENETLAFSCPGDGTIQSIIAYYGQPKGSCGCPNIQQVTTDGNCLGTISSYVVVPYLTYKRQTCLPNADGVTYPCFLGTDRFGTYCCSLSKDSSDKADFSNLAISPNETCNSFTAPTIANALCVGQSSCSFNVSSSTTYRFPVSSIKYGNSSTVCSSIDTSSEEPMCIANLLQGGNFNGCASDIGRNMIFEAICVETSRSINGKTVEFSQLVDVGVYLDCLSILVYILGVFWIRKSMFDEDRIYNSTKCRASNYTVTCSTIPAHRDFADLRQQMIDFFEVELSDPEATSKSDVVRVADVNFSTSCYQYLQAACRRGKIAMEIDGIVAKFCSLIHHDKFSGRSLRDIMLLNSLKKLLYDFYDVNECCRKLQEVASREINRAYITFETEEGYRKCIEKFSPLQKSTHFFPNSVSLDKGSGCSADPVFVKQSPQPDEINWENIGFPTRSRVLRIFLTTLMILTLLATSYFAIFEANYLASKANIFTDVADCGTYSYSLDRDPSFMSTVDVNTITYEKVLWDQDWMYYNQSNYGSNGFLYCFCKNILLQKGKLYQTFA